MHSVSGNYEQNKLSFHWQLSSDLLDLLYLNNNKSIKIPWFLELMLKKVFNLFLACDTKKYFLVHSYGDGWKHTEAHMQNVHILLPAVGAESKISFYSLFLRAAIINQSLLWSKNDNWKKHSESWKLPRFHTLPFSLYNNCYITSRIIPTPQRILYSPETLCVCEGT